MSWMLSVYSACMVAHGFADQSAAHASVVAPAVQTHTASHVSGSRTSRHDHDVAALQHDVLFEMLASADLIIFELRRLLLLALTAKDGDAVEVGEWRRAARHAERLHHVHVAIDDELARLIDLAEHVYLVARGLADRHRDNRVGGSTPKGAWLSADARPPLSCPVPALHRSAASRNRRPAAPAAPVANPSPSIRRSAVCRLDARCKAGILPP